VSLEGVGKAVFEKLNKGLNWDVAPGKGAEKTSVTQRRETGAPVRMSSLEQ